MAATMTIQQSINAGNKAFSHSRSLSAESLQVRELSLAAAKVGTLTTRTSDSVGELTMAASHGITTGVRLDLYWAGGARYGITVGTVSVNQVPLSGGAGDVLPADETAITAMIPEENALSVIGNNIEAFAVYAEQPAVFLFVDGSNVVLAAKTFYDPATGYVWFVDCGETNPLSGDVVTDIFMSHGSSAGAAKVRVAVLHN